jgi:TPR repeat protein
LLHFQGRGLGGAGIDREKALGYFAASARAGDSDAHNNAGTCLEQDIGLGLGLGLPASLTSAISAEDVRPSRALWYYERGARMGSAQAMYSYGYLLLRSAIKAIDAIASAASGSAMDRDRAAAKVREFLLLPVAHLEESEEEENPRALAISTEGPYWRKPAATSGTVQGSDSYANSNHNNNGSSNNSRSSMRGPKAVGGTVGPEPSERERAERQAREGVRWLRAAAERNIKEARYQLGLVYEQVKLVGRGK